LTFKGQQVKHTNLKRFVLIKIFIYSIILKRRNEYEIAILVASPALPIGCCGDSMVALGIFCFSGGKKGKGNGNDDERKRSG
jgi:hypothetical protein